MGQVVYVDLLFLINFSMDFLCFFLCSALLHERQHMARALLASALGGAYGVAALFLPLRGGASLALDLIACGGICLVAYGGREKWRSVPVYILVYTAVSMTLGGFMTALFHLLNRSGLGSSGAIESDGISVWLFALLAALSALITFLGGRFFGKKTARNEAEVCLTYDGQSIRLPAMTDTGNLLRDPMCGRLCILADIGALRGLLPEEILTAAKDGETRRLGGLSERDAGRIRLIPAKTASGQGLLVGIRMERITVRVGRSEREVDATLALADLGKSAGGNRVLLPAELLCV
jgi:stage II sporulation protein GA (sporulation sigma-E factor processing peptidase)